MLRTPSAYELKKYGLYAVLSFFIALSSFLLIDDFAVRNKDIKYERVKQEQLQQLLLDQSELRLQQKALLKDTIYIKRQ